MDSSDALCTLRLRVISPICCSAIRIKLLRLWLCVATNVISSKAYLDSVTYANHSLIRFVYLCVWINVYQALYSCMMWGWLAHYLIYICFLISFFLFLDFKVWCGLCKRRLNYIFVFISDLSLVFHALSNYFHFCHYMLFLLYVNLRKWVSYFFQFQ